MTSFTKQSLRHATILSLLVFVCRSAQAQDEPVLTEGDRTPYVAIKTDRGTRITTAASGTGILVVNFWETSCAPCVKELPSLSTFARRFRSENVTVVAVSGDDDSSKYRRFLRDHHVTLETYRDPSRNISKRFGTFMFPETYVIQNGMIVRKVVGSIDWMSDDISSFVRTKLRQK